MIALGGYTRLSKSGLSMVKWQPLSNNLPSSEEDWEKEFQEYKQYPEYRVSNADIDLNGFKRIYYVEWLHR
jgi:heme a synthase